MSEHVVLLSVPGLRGKDLAAMPNLSRLVAGGDRARVGAEFSLRHLSRASEHDHRRVAGPARRGGERFLLVRPACGRDVDRLERRGPDPANLGSAASARPEDPLGRLVSAVGEGSAGRLDLHAGADP